jgi:RimJ/RimL family protein N-acetyltransferase
MITLRDYDAVDADRLVELADNENVSRYLIYTFPYPYTKEDAEWWIETGSRQHGAVTKAIELEGIFVGSVGITPQPGWRSHLAEIGYWLGEKFWGRGIATEALRQMTERTFAATKFDKLFAPVLAPNRASMKVLEKNNYELEGILKNEVEKGGRRFDIYHYAKQRT